MLSNSEFLEVAYGTLPVGRQGWTASFRGDPNKVAGDAWAGQGYRGTANQRLLIDRRTADNNYYSVAILTGKGRRQKEYFDSLAVLVADDANPTELNAEPSFIIETSPGKHQIGIFLDQDDPAVRDRATIDAVMQAMADARLINADKAGNNAVRYCRLPVGVNGKHGADTPVRVVTWNPNVRYSLEDAVGVFGLDLDRMRAKAVVDVTKTPPLGDISGEAENASLIAALAAANPAERSYHDALLKLSAKLVRSNMNGGAAVNFLRGIMLSVRPTDSREITRWQSRYDEIPRMVAGAAAKFAPEQTSGAVTINLGSKAATSEPEAAFAPVPLDWGQLEAQGAEPAEFVVPGWMPARTTTLLSANGGVGKSNLALQLAGALAVGKTFFGIELEPKRVLVISAEDEGRTVHFRLSNVCRDLGIRLADLGEQLVVYDLSQTDSVLWREGAPTERMSWLADLVERHRAQVVMIDNASDVYAANENDRSEVRGFMRGLNSIAMRTGAAVLLLAHVDKASVRMGAGSDTNSTFSGSTAWNNSARSRWAMTRGNDDEIVLRHEKCNLGALQGEMRLEFDSTAKVFKRYGSVPGARTAAQVLRNSNRMAILKLVAASLRAGQRLSLAATANNNAYTMLSGSKNFPKIERRDFFAILRDMEREGLICESEYEISRGKFAKTLALTDKGLEESLPSWEK